MADDLTAALEEIEKRYGWNSNRYADPEMVRESVEDVPRLLGALRAILEQADKWDVLADRLGSHHSRHRMLKSCANEVREAITREITGKGESDGA